MRLPVPGFLQRGEQRAISDYGDAVLQTILREAGQSIPVSTQTNGALELAAGAIGRAFAVADVVSPSPLAGLFDADTMTLIGRSLIKHGEIVFLLDIDQLGARLIPAATFDVWGAASPASWVYRVDLPGPSGQASRWVEGAAVLHFTYATSAAEPWRGVGPLQAASAAGRLSAEVEKELADEAAGPRGHLLPVPKDGGDETMDGVRADIKRADGRIVTVETTAGNWGDGTMMNAPREDWVTKRFGGDPPKPMVDLNSEAAKMVLGACGVPVELLVSGDGSGQREAWRRFLFGTVAPLGRLVAAELRRKLEAEASIEWDELRASDLVGRARAVGSLVKAGYTPESAAAVAGLGALQANAVPVTQDTGEDVSEPLRARTGLPGSADRPNFGGMD
ncbi:MAG: phage portal protein [Gammaproteobacteria bacterium]|nr:phage portal protein [Gammaproteobacteria bacterium]